jgi:putative ATP-binding cassette transporter
VDIAKGDKILIVGPSGSGKSSFVRAICGLWRVGKGDIFWNMEDNGSNTMNELPRSIFILPQKPYMTLGNLKEQIMYPLHNMSTDVNDDTLNQQLLSILDQVKLDKLANRMGEGDSIRGLHTIQDWSKVLSLGEQQRLSFARIIFNKPKVIVLDESTSALDLALEEVMYENLKDLGVTYISVGHRPSLIKYHNKKLILRGPGYSSIIKDIKGDTGLLD